MILVFLTVYVCLLCVFHFFFFFSSRRRHTRLQGDWSSDVCSSDLQSKQFRRIPSLELQPRRPSLGMPDSWWSAGPPQASRRHIQPLTPSAGGPEDHLSM